MSDLSIAAHVPNLMDRSRFGGRGIVFVNDASAAVHAGLIFVDLDRCTDVADFAVLSGYTVGFGAHVDGDRLEAASITGFDEVMARSAFFRRLHSLIDEHGDGSGARGDGSGARGDGSGARGDGSGARGAGTTETG